MGNRCVAEKWSKCYDIVIFPLKLLKKYREMLVISNILLPLRSIYSINVEKNNIYDTSHYSYIDTCLHPHSY